MSTRRRKDAASSKPVKIKFLIPSVTANYVSELNPILDLSKERCRDIVQNRRDRALKFQEIADFLLSLHLVLEISMNTLMRKLSLRNRTVSNRDFIEVVENLDKVSFLDKVTMFIYNSNFKLDNLEKQEKSKAYEEIIGKIKKFNETRNKLVHGHLIFAVGFPEYKSEAYKILSAEENMSTQISRYKEVIQGISFYLDCLEDLSTTEKQKYKKAYLDDSFLK